MDRPFPIDFSTLEPDGRPRRWLVLPPGFPAAAAADEESPIYNGSAERLLSQLSEVALAEPRTRLVREAAGQLEFVQRSLVFRFPDFVTAAAAPAGAGAALCLYSRAAVGYSDLGVNRRRLRRWMAALQARSG